MHFLHKTFPGASDKISHCAKFYSSSCLISWLPKSDLCETTEGSPPLLSRGNLVLPKSCLAHFCISCNFLFCSCLLVFFSVFSPCFSYFSLFLVFLLKNYVSCLILFPIYTHFLSWILSLFPFLVSNSVSFPISRSIWCLVSSRFQKLVLPTPTVNWWFLDEESVANIHFLYMFFSFFFAVSMIFCLLKTNYCFGALQTILHCIVGESPRGGSIAVAVGVSDRLEGTGDRGQGTGDTQHVTPDTLHLTPDTWHLTLDTWHLTYDIWHMKVLSSSFLS